MRGWVCFALALYTTVTTAAVIPVSFNPTFNFVKEYVRTLVNFPCASDIQCVAAHAIAGVTMSPCVQNRCFDKTILRNALIRSCAASETCFVLDDPAFASTPGLFPNFCAYGRELIDIDADSAGANRIGGDTQDYINNFINLGMGDANDVRIRGGFTRNWFEVYRKLRCFHIPAGTSAEDFTDEQCISRVCGERLDNPALGITARTYDCWTHISDPVPAQYCHLADSTQNTPATGFGQVVCTRDGTYNPTGAFTRPVLNVNAALFVRSAQVAIMGAGTYGVAPADGCGTGVDGDYCVWDDPRGFFIEENQLCFLNASEPYTLSSTCTVQARCNGLGRCGYTLDETVGIPCPTGELYLGEAFEVAAGDVGRAAIDPECLSEPPHCARMAVTRGKLPDLARAFITNSMAWVTTVLAGPHPATTAYVAGDPLRDDTGGVFEGDVVPIAATAVISALTLAANAVNATAYGSFAPAACIITSTSVLLSSVAHCTPTAAPAHPECAIERIDGTVLGHCGGFFATAPLSPDGFVETPPHAGMFLGNETPGVFVAGCIPDTTGVGHVCSSASGAPVAGSDPRCVVQLCNNVGTCGWYTREAGAPCEDYLLPPLGPPPCVRLRCSATAICETHNVPAGEPCSDGNACTVNDVCDGAGACVPGSAVIGDVVEPPGRMCLPCEIDEDCACTGEGSIVGTCDVAAGVCTHFTLLPPLAIDDTGFNSDDPLATITGQYAPLQPWEAERQWAGIGVRMRDDDTDPFVDDIMAAECRPYARRCVRPARDDMTCLVDRRGECHTSGLCDVPAPLMRYAYNASALPDGVQPADLLSARTPCTPANCTLLPIDTTREWFMLDGTECMAEDATCGVHRVCRPAPTGQLTMPTAADCVLPTVCTQEMVGGGPTPAGTPCVPAPVKANADRCVLTWMCDGAGTCQPDTMVDCSGLLFPSPHPTADSIETDYGPCTSPAVCNPTTGECRQQYEPFGAFCRNICGPGGLAETSQHQGVCNGQGVCLRPAGVCPASVDPCLDNFCARYARIDEPFGDALSPYGPFDVEPFQVGQCIYVPSELVQLSGGSNPCTDGDQCTVPDICDGAGTCVAGPDVVCPEAAVPCATGIGCSPSSGRCILAPIAPGTSCLIPDQCLRDLKCTVSGACQGVEVVCPDLPPELGGGTACQGVQASCAGIIQAIANSTALPGGFGYVSVILDDDAGTVITLVDTLEQVSAFFDANMGVFINGTTPRVGMLVDKIGRVLGQGSLFTPATLIVNTDGVVVSTIMPGVTVPSGLSPSVQVGQVLAGICIYGRLPDGAECSDGLNCTETAICIGGTCQRTVPTVCGTGNTTLCQSRNGTCMEGLGCVYPPAFPGTPCDDGQACTHSDVCLPGGTCLGTPGGCSISVPACMSYAVGQDACTGCTLASVPDGTVCNCDSTSGDCFGTCTAGVCIGPTDCVPACAAPNFRCSPIFECVCAPGYRGDNCEINIRDGASAGGSAGLSIFSSTAGIRTLVLLLLIPLIISVTCYFLMHVPLMIGLERRPHWYTYTNGILDVQRAAAAAAAGNAARGGGRGGGGGGGGSDGGRGRGRQ